MPQIICLGLGQANFKNTQFDWEDRQPRVGGLAHTVPAIQEAFPSVCAPPKLLFIVKTLFWISVHRKVIPDLSRWNNHCLLCPTSVIYVCLLSLI